MFIPLGNISTDNVSVTVAVAKGTTAVYNYMQNTYTSINIIHICSCTSFTIYTIPTPTSITLTGPSVTTS